MPRYTHYDELRLLDDWLAIPLYIFFELWNILVSGSAGSVAVAVGAHMTATNPGGRASDVAFGVVVICVTSLSILGTVFKLWDPSPLFAWLPAGRQRRMISERSRFEQRIDGVGIHSSHARRGRWELEVPDFCGGVFFSTLVILFLILVILALFLGLFIAFGAGFAALTMKLLADEIPKWAIIASLPATIFALPGVAAPVKWRAPTQIVSWTIAGVVFAKVSEAQGHHICSLNVAAAAGAASGTMLWVGKLPIHLLNGTFYESRQTWAREEVTDGNYWARRLFPPLDDSNGARVEIRRREREILVERAWANEERELKLFPEMHKVFWSRPASLDKVSHYVLLVNGHKYELRDVSAERDRSLIKYRTAKVNYSVPNRHTAWVKEVTDELRGGVYDLLLIGWTSLTHDQIDSICKEADKTWRYRLYWRGRQSGNCQHFVRVIADQVMSRKHRASNWGWFRYDRMGDIQLAAEQSAIELERQAREHEEMFGTSMSVL